MVPLPRVCVLLLGIPILYSRFVKFRPNPFVTDLSACSNEERTHSMSQGQVVSF